MVELEHARALLEQMGLNTAAQLLDAQLEQSLHAQQTYVQFLNELLSSEQQERQRKSRETRLKLARLPHRKGLEDFDFAFQPSIDKRQIEELGTLAFVARDENVILLGPPGVGKTHLAVGLALKALDAGMVVYYKLLCLLSKNVGKVLTHTFITQNIWGRSWDNDIASLRVFMATLRKKLGPTPESPQYIQTHIGVGYRMMKVE